MAKPILVSGMQPSGRLHIGNYLGALKNLVELQNSSKYECYFMVVDLHSLTESASGRIDPKEKHAQILDLLANYLAAGLDPKKSTLFLQSLVPAHTELTWILNTITPMGELERMTQFKDKMKHNPENVNLGLFSYPVLMAADIMLYDAKFVPVGDDQDQHLELTRTLVRKFNARFPARPKLGGGGGETFIEPKIVLTKTPRVMSLDNPLKKMSKSQPKGCLFLDDAPRETEEKLMRAVTDSGNVVKYDEKEKPAISNLLEIYSSLSGESIPALEKKFTGTGYGEFKKSLANVIANHFESFREKKKKLLANPQTLVTTLKTGSKKAAKVANKKMVEVKKKVGIALE